jgi:hypothetical protein
MERRGVIGNARSGRSTPSPVGGGVAEMLHVGVAYARPAGVGVRRVVISCRENLARTEMQSWERWELGVRDRPKGGSSAF